MTKIDNIKFFLKGLLVILGAIITSPIIIIYVIMIIGIQTEIWLKNKKRKKCACGKQDILGGAEVEIGGVCHRPDNPCYIIHNEIKI